LDSQLPIGALVEVRKGIEDNDLPADRIGLIVEKDEEGGIYQVLLSNGKRLQFNPYWLTALNTA
jgi:hypothetical protein